MRGAYAGQDMEPTPMTSPPSPNPSDRSGTKSSTVAPVRRPESHDREPQGESAAGTILDTRDLSLWYGAHQALKKITFGVGKNLITAIIGPSGCGKSTLLRCFNRMNDLFPPVRYEGALHFYDTNIMQPGTDLVALRRRIGMVFQRANPFPMSIFQNVAYGPKLQGTRNRQKLEAIVESALRRAALWEEVKDRLNRSALSLSGGQQQRLCIARALAVEPEVLLLDEPASALDPTATAKIEELILEIKSSVTVAIVTHNMQQAARVSDRTAFMLSGELIEEGPTRALFTSPRERLTEDYITGRFG
jgi:phosphate transport system ATP-binding protein